MIEGIGFYCGMVMRWFRDAFCARRPPRRAGGGEDAYALLERGRGGCRPGADGVFGIFSNLMQAGRWVHAAPALRRLRPRRPRQRSGAGECFRAIEESAAYVARGHLEIVEEVTGRRSATS